MARGSRLPGFQRLPGKSGRYLNPSTGEVLTRRQVDDKVAQANGWANSAEYQRASKAYGGLGGMQSRESKFISEMLNRFDANPTFLSTKKLGSERSEFSKSLEFRRALAAFKRDGFQDKSPQGGLAQMLEAAGVRERGAPYNVGDTPRKKRRA